MQILVKFHIFTEMSSLSTLALEPSKNFNLIFCRIDFDDFIDFKRV